MSTIRVKADKSLFDEWNLLGAEVARVGRSIVQNDVDVEISQFARWKSDMIKLHTRLDALTLDTIIHVTGDD